MKCLGALGVLLLAATIGCVTTTKESFDEWGLGRAAFEMRCPRAKLTVVGLNADLESEATAGKQVGVEGCGRRGVYVLTDGAGWVANTSQPAASTERSAEE